MNVKLKNNERMDNIELFDKYIKGNLSRQEQIEFDNQLKSDKEFAAEFKLYLFSVDGICRETEQDNIEFGVAMKNITKEQLREIIGPRKEAVRPKVLKFRPWIWQVASIAAVVVIAFTVVFQFEKQSRYNVDDAIYACAGEDAMLWRSGAEQVDITTLSNDELKAQLPKLIELYNTATDNQEIADNGYALAMAYVRLHDRENARDILSQLIQRFGNDEDFQDDVKKYKSILRLIK
jgi:anti-sigma-K factor RskA